MTMISEWNDAMDGCALLLARLAECERDAKRYRLFAETVAAEFAGETLTGSHKALFDAMNSREEISGVGDVDAMLDAAMEAADA